MTWCIEESVSNDCGAIQGRSCIKQRPTWVYTLHYPLDHGWTRIRAPEQSSEMVNKVQFRSYAT